MKRSYRHRSKSNYVFKLPFGEEIQSGTGGRTTAQRYGGQDSIRRKFTGYERDTETDLDFAQARMYHKNHGRFTSVDPLMASAKTIRPESWNRYVYCYNNPLALVDPDGMDVQALDEKARQRILSTLPEELRKKVEKQIDKNGLLKKGALDKIKSKDANFQDLKAMVNGKGVVEVMTASKDERGTEFIYNTKEEIAQEIKENMQKLSATQEEIDETLKEQSDQPNIFDGRTLSAAESPSGNIRIILADGTGKTSDEPAVRLAQTTGHELYGHGYLAQQGKAWKHDDGGPVDVRIRNIETRTEKLYQPKPQPQQVKPKTKP